MLCDLNLGSLELISRELQASTIVVTSATAISVPVTGHFPPEHDEMYVSTTSPYHHQLSVGIKIKILSTFCINF